MSAAGRVLERLALMVLLIGGAAVTLSMFLGTADVIGTQFFGWPVPGTLEITESTMVLIVFGALAYAQIRRSHIRVELVYVRMGPRVRAAMDVFADVAALTFFALLLWQAIAEATFSWQIGETADGLWRFPLYPARIVLAAGTALLIAQLVLDLVRDLRCLRDGAPYEPPAPAAPPPIEGLRDPAPPRTHGTN